MKEERFYIRYDDMNQRIIFSICINIDRISLSFESFLSVILYVCVMVVTNELHKNPD